MTFLKYVMAFVVIAALTACGGGGGSAGTTSSTASPPLGAASAPAATAADFFFELDKTTIVNSGSDKAVLTVTAVDINRNILAGVSVSVVVDSNGVFAGTAGGKTDESGKYSGNITMGSDKSNRSISASITVNGVTKVASITVVGSQISVTPVPVTPAPGQLVALNISTTDTVNAVIQNAVLSLAGTAGASGTVNTGVAGIVASTFTAPSIAGTYTVVVTGLGVSTTKNIVVAAAGGGGIPAAVTGLPSASSLSPQPTSIPTNTSGSTTNRSKLSAKFLTTGNAGIQNMRVRFEIVAPALGGGEVISTGDSTVYTDVSGTAEADYISGTRSSPTNGVLVRVCYKATDFASTSDCPQSVNATLTVAGAPLSISISDNNKLAAGLGGIAYLKQFLIQVNDASGVAVKDAVISASVDITHYGKGSTWSSAYRDVDIPTIRDMHQNFLPTSSPVNYVQSLTSSATPPLANQKTWCINEDWNRNGSLDTGEGEDRNRNGTIQPRKAEIVVSYVSGNKTDPNGQMLLQISYGQNMGGWLAYTLRATTSVAGSEGDASKAYVTDVLQTDVANGSFLTPPYGSGACDSPN